MLEALIFVTLFAGSIAGTIALVGRIVADRKRDWVEQEWVESMLNEKEYGGEVL